MFARIAAFAAVAFPILAAAQSCNTGPVQCCNTIQSSDSDAGATILSLIGAALGDVTAQIGLGCTPVSAIGVGAGNACNANPVCCENNNVGGLVSVGCVPVSL
ncbi:fungal hydrophobin-domain-containing protein [Trametes maxima]|nr:fungal hydrophobin-domain-containing protein [Trametes maxima]